MNHSSVLACRHVFPSNIYAMELQTAPMDMMKILDYAQQVVMVTLITSTPPHQIYIIT